jgi:hypothetical protein
MEKEAKDGAKTARFLFNSYADLSAKKMAPQ